MSRFGRVLTAMVTPFDEHDALDLGAAASLARWLVDQGNDGLVLAGTTGESPTLSDAEKLDLVRAVREAVTVPLVVGTGSNDTAHSIELTAAAAGAGADGVLLVTPYYSRPSQAGLFDHFAAVAGATTLPAMLYDIPVRTGRKIDTNTLLRLVAEVPNIVAVKDAAGDPAESARFIAAAGESAELYSGDDALTLPLLSVGAVGVVSVASHWAASGFTDMVNRYFKGDIDRARLANARLLSSYAFESTADAPNPVPAKAMLRVLGQRAGRCRPPMGPEPEGLEAAARVLAAELDLKTV